MTELKENHLYFWLSGSGINIRQQYKLLDFYGGIEAVYKAVRDKSASLFNCLNDKEINNAVYSSDSLLILKEYNNISSAGINIITYGSEYYPECLMQREVSAAVCFYTLGNKEIIFSQRLAIVGTRRCTDYGAKMTRQFSSALASEGLTIVSGLADGIDTIAHEGALDVNGATIAVLGGGFNYIYPASNKGLARRIIKDGLLISEYSPDTQPQKHHFPERNRIISGLSRGVFVVEGGEKSGSLITADLAVEQGRELFVLPGRVDSPNSAGTLNLIKALPHAMVTKPEDILKALNIRPKIKKTTENISGIQLDFLENMVYNSLMDGEKHFNVLLKTVNTDTMTLNNILVNLEIKGLITKKAGNIYSI